MATDYGSESDLKYIETLTEIPLSGPDEFIDEEKLEAAEFGESKLEADVNSGNRIIDEQVTHLHEKAATAWASYILFSGGESPTSALSGDLVEGSSSDAMEFAREMKSIYKETISSILKTDEEEQSDEITFQVFDH